MKWKLVNDAPRTFVQVFDTGDEVVSGITALATENNVLAASITAIGAFSNATIGYFDLSVNDYKKIPVAEQVEVLSLIGDLIRYEGKPKLHAHVVLGKSDGSTRGGHLLAALVKPTLEVVITELPAWLHREMDPKVHIPLIKL